MKRVLFFLSVIILSFSYAASQPSDIYKDGVRKKAKELFPTYTSEAVPYRIPSIARTSEGDLVAIADYRFCRADIGFGHIDLHCRISNDNGKSWGNIFTIIEGDGKKIDDNPNLSLTAGYGDPCLVADCKSERVLLICVCGYQTFFNSSRQYPNQVARLYSEDGGKTWGAPEIITEQFYKPLDDAPVGPIKSMFIGSGRIHQSRYVKVADYYRLYVCMLARDKDNNFCNFVVYSDDFGLNWNILGGVDVAPIPTGGDEPKTEELPDGSLLLSSRCSGGRLYNIFTFTNAKTAKGSWGKHAFSGKENSGVEALNNSCNGELLILPVTRNCDNKDMYIVLQSLPFGSGRANVGIYYKELASVEDFDTPENFARDWDGRFQVTHKASAYSTMIEQKDGTIAFLYEEDTYGTNGGGYTIAYKNYSVDEITKGAYSFNKKVNRKKFLKRLK